MEIPKEPDEGRDRASGFGRALSKQEKHNIVLYVQAHDMDPWDAVVKVLKARYGCSEFSIMKVMVSFDLLGMEFGGEEENGEAK